ncbi:MAG TPA: GNAT family N-acetyltransferase [archaeon]|nr:GNAT family N-acetyltransferase [archaeon]
MFPSLDYKRMREYGLSFTYSEWERRRVIRKLEFSARADFSRHYPAADAITFYSSELGYIQILNAHPNLRRRGIGSSFYAQIESILRERNVNFFALLSHRDTEDFWKRQGYSRIHETSAGQLAMMKRF